MRHFTEKEIQMASDVGKVANPMYDQSSSYENQLPFFLPNRLVIKSLIVPNTVGVWGKRHFSVFSV